MEIIEVDREAFRKAVEPVYQKHAGKFGLTSCARSAVSSRGRLLRSR